MEQEKNSKRIESIYQMLFEMAAGNFNFRIEKTGSDDELEGLIVLVNMVAEELRANVFHNGYVNSHFTFQYLIQNTFILNQEFIIKSYNPDLGNSFGFSPDEIFDRNFSEFLSQESLNVWNLIRGLIISDVYYHKTFQFAFKAKGGLLIPAFCTVTRLLLDFHSFENTIEKAISEWDYYPEVKTWKQEKFKYILLTKLPHFDYGNSLSIWSIKRFADLFSIDKFQLADIILEILPQKIDLLSDESIYSCFELIKSKLSPSDNEALITWGLQRWNSKIEDNIADGIWEEELTPAIDPSENIACLLRFILGHPDKKLRWMAVHSIRRLVKLDNLEILKGLLANQNKKSCFPFQNKKYIFYWMSAKLYLWIAINRISIENPKMLIPLKDIFYSELMNEALPHVLIRQYIKKSCLNLYGFDKAIYSESEFQNIQQVNKGKLGYVEEKKYSRQQRKYSTKSKKKWRFKFDSLDTLPYWYSRVGDAFNLSEYDVADVADKFINEKWGYTGNPNKDDFIRSQLNQRDWHLTRNDHGSNPQIEDLSIYFEYHAMYCAANFLLENEPLLETDMAWYSWENWLDSEANAFDEFWLSDLRDPIPLKPSYWKNPINKFDKEWRDTIAEEYFDENICFINDVEDRFLNMYGGITRNIGANQETISVSSCLVSSKAAEALLRALQSAKDSHDYSIPFDEENENEYDRASIDENGFSLTGWIMDIRSEFEGLDSDDIYFNGTSKGYVRFGKTVHTHFNVEYDNLYKQGYLDNRLISKFENWNEVSDEEYRYKKYNTGIETSGSIFKVDREFILSVLKTEQKCLIVKCVIDRQLKNENTGNDMMIIETVLNYI